MIRVEGRAEQDAYVAATVWLDDESVGQLHLSLAQWDRLRQHRTSGASPVFFAGGAVLMMGNGVGVEVESV